MKKRSSCKNPGAHLRVESMRNKRVHFVLLCSLIPFAGCPSAPEAPRYMGAGHSSPQRGGTFVFYHMDDVRSLDPHTAYDELSNIGIKLLFEGLLDYDSEAKLIPALAESLPEVSSAGLRYTFTLRPNLRFHNGRALNAEDVQWSIEKMLSPDTGSPGYNFFSLLEGLDAYRQGKQAHISGIQVLDARRIAFQLTEPDQTFLNAIAMTFAYPVPKENYLAHPNDVSRHPVGTGAFVLESWEPGVRIIFRRNPFYHQQGKPYVDRMVYWLNLSREAAVMRFRNAEIDVLHRFPRADYFFFKQSSTWKPYFKEEPEVNLWGLTMNCELFPFNNRHIRRAVSFAIRRDWWNKAKAYRLHLTGQPVPPGLLGYDENLPTQHRYDLARAKEEMRLAGFPKGIREPVTLLMANNEGSDTFGELIQEDLRAIGIPVDIRWLSFPVWMEETAKRKNAQLFLSGWSQDFPDPSDFLDILFHSRAIHDMNSENKSFYSNPTLDTLLDRARVEVNKEKRRQLYIKAQMILTEDAPWVFIWNDLKPEAWQPYVKNYHPNPVWSEFYRDVWLDLPRKANNSINKDIP